MIPLFVGVVSTTFWLYISPSIIESHLLLFTLILSFIFGRHVGGMILSHVTKSPFSYYTHGFLVVTMGCLGSYMIKTYAPMFGKKNISRLEGYFMIGLLMYAIIEWGIFVLRVIYEICNVFDIWCLRIKPQHSKHQHLKHGHFENDSVIKISSTTTTIPLKRNGNSRSEILSQENVVPVRRSPRKATQNRHLYSLK